MDQVAIPSRARAGFPPSLTWEATHCCSSRCLYCPSDSGPEVSTAGDLGTEEALAAIDRLASNGVAHLTLSGGEPLLRTDWGALVARAVKRGLAVSVFTNGSPVTAAVADDLLRLGVASVAVSLDSHNPAVHDQLHQLPGLFRRATEAIRLLAERGLRVVVQFVPTRANLGDARGVVELARRLGAQGVNLGKYVVAGRAAGWLAPADGALARLTARWNDLAEQLRGEIGLTRVDEHERCAPPEASTGSPEERYVPCGSAGLLPDGTLTRCLAFPVAVGSLMERPPAATGAA